VKPLIACQYLELAGSGLGAGSVAFPEASEVLGFKGFPLEIKGESLVGVDPSVNSMDLRAVG